MSVYQVVPAGELAEEHIGCRASLTTLYVVLVDVEFDFLDSRDADETGLVTLGWDLHNFVRVPTDVLVVVHGEGQGETA